MNHLCRDEAASAGSLDDATRLAIAYIDAVGAGEVDVRELEWMRNA